MPPKTKTKRQQRDEVEQIKSEGIVRSESAKNCGGKKIECSPVCGISDISADAHAIVHGIVVYMP